MFRSVILAALYLVMIFTGQSVAQALTGGADCSVVQAALKAKGYDIGEIDGQCGPKTAKAVAAYQIDEGLEVTGALTREAAAVLIGGEAAAAASADQPYQQLAGQWKGTYRCSGQLAGVTYTFRHDPEDESRLRGEFEFYPVKGSPSSIKAGAYTFYARQQRDGSVKVEPLSWITQPKGYYHSQSWISPSADGTSATGVFATRKCEAFLVSRVGAAIALGGAVPEPASQTATAPQNPAKPALDAASTAGGCAEIQTALTRLGYSPGTSGQCDDATVAAIKAYQKFLGVEQTGTLDIGYRRSLLARAATSWNKLTPDNTATEVEANVPRSAGSCRGSDCEVLAGLVSVLNGKDPQRAKTKIGNACRTLLNGEYADEDATLCYLGAYARRDELRLPAAFFAGGGADIGAKFRSAGTCDGFTRVLLPMAEMVTRDRPRFREGYRFSCEQVAETGFRRNVGLPWQTCATAEKDVAIVSCYPEGEGSPNYLADFTAAVVECASKRTPRELIDRIREFASQTSTYLGDTDCNAIFTQVVRAGVLDGARLAEIQREQEAARIAALPEYSCLNKTGPGQLCYLDVAALGDGRDMIRLPRTTLSGNDRLMGSVAGLQMTIDSGVSNCSHVIGRIDVSSYYLAGTLRDTGKFGAPDERWMHARGALALGFYKFFQACGGFEHDLSMVMNAEVYYMGNKVGTAELETTKAMLPFSGTVSITEEIRPVADPALRVIQASLDLFWEGLMEQEHWLRADNKAAIEAIGRRNGLVASTIAYGDILDEKVSWWNYLGHNKAGYDFFVIAALSGDEPSVLNDYAAVIEQEIGVYRMNAKPPRFKDIYNDKSRKPIVDLSMCLRAKARLIGQPDLDSVFDYFVSRGADGDEALSYVTEHGLLTADCAAYVVARADAGNTMCGPDRPNTPPKSSELEPLVITHLLRPRCIAGGAGLIEAEAFDETCDFTMRLPMPGSNALSTTTITVGLDVSFPSCDVQSGIAQCTSKIGVSCSTTVGSRAGGLLGALDGAMNCTAIGVSLPYRSIEAAVSASYDERDCSWKPTSIALPEGEHVFGHTAAMLTGIETQLKR